MTAKAKLVSAASGLVWGLFGFLMVSDTNRTGVALAALMASPVIGLGAGWLTMRVRHRGLFVRLMFALLNLYLAVALFALVMVLWHVGTSQGTLPTRESGVVGVLTSIGGLLLGFTGAGWPLFLWPASVANQSIIWRAATGPGAESVALSLR